MAVWSKLFSTSALLSLMRVVGAALGFGTQILLARILDADGLGLFYFVSSVAMVGGLVAATGYPGIMSRFVSRYRERGQPGYLSGFLRRAHAETLVWACAGSLGLALIGLLAPGYDADARMAFVLSALTIAPMAIQRVYTALATAYREFMCAYLPALFIRPVLFALALLGALWAGWTLSVAAVAGLALASYAAITIFQWAMIGKPARDAMAAPPKTSPRLLARWRREAVPQVAVAAFTSLLIEMATLLVTPFMSLADVGAFGVALRVAFLIGFTVQVSHQVILPDLGDAIARRDNGSVRTKIIGASLFPVALTVGGVLGSMAFGDHLLALFGEEFRSAQTTLTVLMLAQLIRALAGPSSLLLTLKGAQDVNAYICIGSLAVLIASNAVLAPLFGAVGGAWAVVITTAVWLGATAIALYRIDRARTDLAGLLMRPRGFSAAK